MIDISLSRAKNTFLIDLFQRAIGSIEPPLIGDIVNDVFNIAAGLDSKSANVTHSPD
jgi:hypothetical protein